MFRRKYILIVCNKSYSLLTQRRYISVDGQGCLGSVQVLYLAHSFLDGLVCSTLEITQ